jgi:glycosyltransferase involved in cell wall biosynthesis
MKTNLIIISNEKCCKEDRKIFCQNLEMKLLAEDLDKYFNTKLILRSSKIEPVHEIKNSNIFISSNILFFLKNVLFSVFKNKTKYFIISITPYTSLSFLILFLFRKKVFLYLRSDGKKEISLILGNNFKIIYKIIENWMSRYCELVIVNNEIIKNRRYHLVSPSSIDEDWFKNISTPTFEKIKLLYVGRIKVEKGIYSLINIFDKVVTNKRDIILTLIGHGEKLKNLNSKIKLLSPISEKINLIRKYDEHNIVILPSFTEGHPRVLVESLVRKRPVIIFDDIIHVKQNYNGVYVSKREPNDLIKIVDYIISNYSKIQKEMEKNDCPTKEQFILQLKKIINS